MGTPSNTDTAAFVAITSVIGVTILWWISVYARIKIKASRRGKRKSRHHASLKRRGTNATRAMDGRVNKLFTESKNLRGVVENNRLGLNAAQNVVQADQEKSTLLLYITSASMFEYYDKVKLRHSREEDVTEENKIISNCVAYVEGLITEVDELVTAVVNIKNAPEHKAELNVVIDKLKVVAKNLEVADRTLWRADSPDLQKLESQVNAKAHFSQMGDNDDDGEVEDEAGCMLRIARKYIPQRFRQHPVFYFIFWGLYAAIIMSHWVFIYSGELRPNTFLSTPPQYDLKNAGVQRFFVPIIFGLMHSALYCFGVLPVAMARGLLRDLVKVFPSSRRHIPIDDMTWFHMLVGTLCIMHIFIATNIWLVTMGVSCMSPIYEDKFLELGGPDTRARACLAFNPKINDAKRGDGDGEVLFDSLPGASYLDPRDNVLFLREIVWFTWMLAMPLVYWARSPPNPRLPTWFKRNWWEICYYLHLFGGVASIVIALYARFEVFYPMLIGGWSFYFLDKLRELFFKTYSTEIVVNASMPQESSYHIKSEQGQPTVLALKFKKPKNFEQGKGQWLYCQVDSIDWVWHPFSMSSATGDRFVELLVGIQGKWPKDKKDANGDWLQLPEERTWTYNLLTKFRKHATKSLSTRRAQNIKCKLRGPYGSPFSKCFDNRYPAVVLIGAGTGLTSALSVLKEMVRRRARGESTQHVWFVWSCRRVDDLLMCWRALHELLFDAFQRGTVQLDGSWNPLSNVMLDWLSMTIYVTRADREALIHFLDSSMPDARGKTAKAKKSRVKSPVEKDAFSIKSGDLEDLDKLAAEADAGKTLIEIEKPKIKKPIGGRWKKAVMKVAVHTGKLDGFTGWLMNMKNEGLPGDFVLRRSPFDHSLVLSILIDGHFNQFEHHALRQYGKGPFTIDGHKMSKDCSTPEEVVQHLSMVADGISIPLRLPRSEPEEECYLSTAAKNLLLIPDEDNTTSSVTKNFHQGKTQKERENEVEDIHTWMKEQVLETSMDNPHASIGALFKWVRQYTSDPHNGIKGGADAQIAICFCGPSALAHAIARSAVAISGSMEFSSEHQ